MPSSSGSADGDVPSASVPTFLPTFGHAVDGPGGKRRNGASASPAPPVTLLIGHGTRDAEGAREALDFAARLAARLADQPGPAGPVVPCFLELTDPPILPTIARCVEAGAAEVVALPLMLFGANHVKSDIPAALAVARARHPGLAIRYGAPLGVQPELLEALDERIAAVEAASPLPAGDETFPDGASPRISRAETAILLVERGSSDPDANAQVYQLGRMLWEGRGFGWVEPCFIGITRPTLEEGLARCLALGARRVLVLPYFLFTGVLVRRIGRIVAEFAAGHPSVDFRVAEHLGCHPRLLDLAVRRIEEARRGAVAMSCDRCKWRVPLVGFAHQVGRPQRSDGAHGLRESDRTADHDHRHRGFH
jgi:sirohydrochlorin cobaltochelatase